MKDIILIDPKRSKFFKDKHFILNDRQIKAIKTSPVQAILAGVDLDVYKAFILPENQHILNSI